MNNTTLERGVAMGSAAAMLSKLGYSPQLRRYFYDQRDGSQSHRNEFFNPSGRYVLWVDEGVPWDEFVTEFQRGARGVRSGLAQGLTHKELDQLYKDLRPYLAASTRVDWGDNRTEIKPS